MRVNFSTRVGKRSRVGVSSKVGSGEGLIWGLTALIVGIYTGIFKGIAFVCKWLWGKARWVLALLFLFASFSFLPNKQWGEFVCGLGLSAFFAWPYLSKLWKKNDKTKAFHEESEPVRNSEEPPFAPVRATDPYRYATSRRVEVGPQNRESIRSCFIAFDVETTGLSRTADRIVEIGAVLFRDGEVIDSFSTLVNPEIAISYPASQVNQISNEMLAEAPAEAEVYPKLLAFLGAAVTGDIVMCAHNASFDFGFLCNTLNRLGYGANFRYVDTLSLARKYLVNDNLGNYKQETIEAHYGLNTGLSHNAAYDAENCGHILYRLLENDVVPDEAYALEVERDKLTSEEISVCAFIQTEIAHRGADTAPLRFRKTSQSYVEASCFYEVCRFKFAKKGHYIIVESINADVGLTTEPCTKSEGEEYKRVFFASPSDLNPLGDYFYEKYLSAYESMNAYSAIDDSRKRDVERRLRGYYGMTNADAAELLTASVQ